MFRVPLLAAIALAIAFGGGIAMTRYAIRHSSGFGAITLGPWQAYPKAQTEDADPYARNHRARAGRLLLGSAEGLVLYASTDSNGGGLSSACTYVLSGKMPIARFWTLTATTAENAPIAGKPGLPAALNSQQVLYGNDGTVTIRVSSDAQPGNWLAVPAGLGYHLAFTLFDTPVAGSSGVIDQSMPAISREGCGHA